MRFGIIDPIMKGIIKCTNTVVAAEESVSKSELPKEEQPSTSQLDTTPVQQRTISTDIVPDYRFYLLVSSAGQYPVVAMAEVKQRKHFNDRSTCQTIGYHIASHADVRNDNPSHPPLFFLICEDLLRFVFFPFLLWDKTPCIDAIVTPAIPLFCEDGVTLNERWFTFICYYINNQAGHVTTATCPSAFINRH